MNIEEMTIGQAREIASIFSGRSDQRSIDINGFRIAVLDQGFVFVGHCDTKTKPGTLIITKCRNIRYWGTKNGLGELRDGPLKETKLDDVGTVEVPEKSLIFTIPCNREF